MDNDMMGLKEIYNCIIKSTYDIEVGNQKIIAGEPLVVFKTIQLANFKEVVKRAESTGGYENQTWVSWESSQEIQIDLQEGVFSKVHLAFIHNADIEEGKTLLIPKEEFGVPVERDSQISLKFTPTEKLYIYNEEGKKCNVISQDTNRITIDNVVEGDSVDVYYDFYTQSAATLAIGRKWLNGFLTMTAKTRLKDDRTGKTVTGIFQIPKLRLVSDFSIRLGNDVPPPVGRLNISALPTGSKGSKTIMNFIMLNDDIDSDI